MLVINPNLPVQTAAQLLTYLKANPGKMSFASAGNGTTSHMAGESFRRMADVDIQHIPFNGAAPAVNSLVGNQTPIGCLGLPPAQPQLKSGALRAIRSCSKAAGNAPLIA
jgi:tripartite-type tricarboxylate transporter receptor subunit TctC